MSCSLMIAVLSYICRVSSQPPPTPPKCPFLSWDVFLPKCFVNVVVLVVAVNVSIYKTCLFPFWQNSLNNIRDVQMLGGTPKKIG